MQRQTVLLIWIGGLALAVLLYLTGPDQFLAACLDLMDGLNAWVHNLMLTLGARAADVLRAAAIAVYVVFMVLAFLAGRRGLRSGAAIAVVTAVMLLLVWRPESPYPAPMDHWFAALVLSVVAAIAMTHRLLGPPPPSRGPWQQPFRPPPQ